LIILPSSFIITLLARGLWYTSPSVMVKVTYNGTVLAESNDTVIVEGNHYFPPSSVKTDLFTKSPTKYVCFPVAILILDLAMAHRTVCPWKG
jgi:uncharacterized protein (DUF427 family)